MRGQSDNRLLRWAVYQLAWWIVKRRARVLRRRAIAGAAIAVVIAAGAAIAVRSRSN